MKITVFFTDRPIPKHPPTFICFVTDAGPRTGILRVLHTGHLTSQTARRPMRRPQTVAPRPDTDVAVGESTVRPAPSASGRSPSGGVTVRPVQSPRRGDATSKLPCGAYPGTGPSSGTLQHRLMRRRARGPGRVDRASGRRRSLRRTHRYLPRAVSRSPCGTAARVTAEIAAVRAEFEKWKRTAPAAGGAKTERDETASDQRAPYEDALLGDNIFPPVGRGTEPEPGPPQAKGAGPVPGYGQSTVS